MGPFGSLPFGARPFDATPTFTVAAVVSPSVTAGTGGRVGRRRQELWSVTVDGKAYVFDSLDSLIAFLDKREEVAAEKAEVKAERDARRIISKGLSAKQSAPPRVRIESGVPEIKEYVDAVQKKIDRVYWRALADAMAREAEEAEDIKFIASIDYD